MGPFLNRLIVEGGYRRGDSDRPDLARSSYDLGWLGFQGILKKGEELSLLAKIQAQVGSGPELEPSLLPHLTFSWRVFESTQWVLYWGVERSQEDFRAVFGKALHTSFRGGFPAPAENLGEWGTRFTQKIGEPIVVTLSATHAEWSDYHQWSDLDPLGPTFIQAYSTLPKIRLTRVGGNFQWALEKDWQVAGSYLWTQGEDLSGTGLNLTNFPAHKGSLSLYRGDETWEARLELTGATERHSDEVTAAISPAYLSLGLAATYRLTKTFSLWFNGDNLLGADQEIQPGYPEPKLHVRAGAEIIF
jgi:hypothetical protein